MYIVLLILVIILSYSVFPTIYLKLKFKLRKKNNDKVIYLTFDDGPSKYTEEFLDLFKKYKIKVSFFVVTEFAKLYESTIKKEQKDGHLICYHSLNHKDYIKIMPMETITNFNSGLRILNKMGVKIKYFRAPWGRINLTLLRQIKKNNLKLIIWDVMAQDWEANISSEEIANRLLKRTKNGSVICIHDGRGKNDAPKRTLEALYKVIPIFLEKGYKFETIDKLDSNI
jgi:peptidoglycan/xylan/chitin deacetylase (PgdA/CDA1 family)